jgi:hypothetical protein
MVSNDYRESWRKDWLSSIAELADIDEQRKLWLNLDQRNPHYSFVEYVNGYFDQFIVDEYEYFIEKNYVSKQEALCVKKLHSLLKTYEPPNGDNYDHQTILNDPGWLEIVNEAKAATSCLREVLAGDEVWILEGRLH